MIQVKKKLCASYINIEETLFWCNCQFKILGDFPACFEMKLSKTMINKFS